MLSYDHHRRPVYMLNYCIPGVDTNRKDTTLGMHNMFIATQAKSTEIGKEERLRVAVKKELSRSLRLPLLQIANAFNVDSLLRRAGVTTTAVQTRRLGCNAASGVRCDPNALFRTADGTCNNLQFSKWGSAFIPMRRFQPPAYDDGASEPRTQGVDGSPLPSARVVSREIHENDRGQGEMSTLTHMVMQWGQFLDHDITSTPHQTGHDGAQITCCEEDITSPTARSSFTGNLTSREACFPIDIPPGDNKFRSRTCLNFVRSLQTIDASCRTEPVEQLNQITAYIDGSMIYGSSQDEQNNLRAFTGGRLKVSDNDLLPPDREESCVKSRQADFCFKAGDARVNEQMALASMHTVWLREHNRIAQQLVQLNPSWTDDRVFEETRKIVGAMIQHITFTQWLPIVLNNQYLNNNNLDIKSKDFDDRYNKNMDASIRNVFATAAFRFGHSLVKTFFSQLARGYSDNGRHLVKEAFGRTSHILSNSGEGVNQYIRGLVKDTPERVDRFITSQLTDHLFEDTFGDSLDLAALNIQRGRDHGIPSYNVWRRWCGLSTFNNFQSMPGLQPGAAQQFSRIYRTPEDIDVFSGGLSEVNIAGGLVGPTFACILANQFRAIREGDRFWYDRPGNTGFTQAQLNSIKMTSLSRILCDNTDIQTIQYNPFWQPDQSQPLQACGTLPALDLSLWSDENGGGNPGRYIPPAEWSRWGPWSSCYNGQKSRTRTCEGEGSCRGKDTQTRQCNNGGSSPGQGGEGWGEWGSWNQCNGGKQWRWRQCFGVSSYCAGPSASSQPCGGSKYIPRYCLVEFFRQSGICAGYL
ncbi:hypothetical protein SNE40_017509 [Patella caerulea]|uniref:Uncharacterized protein n=1 Tax=Patella caerulea TaxID=87958 RepID=A0AAN8JHQ9_PATCE